MKILVCDDDREIVEAITIYLEKEGYSVIAAYNGKEALDTLRREQVQLIILDIMMPEMDGIEALFRLRECSSIPVILLSAKSEDADKINGLNVGADDYITKPFNILEVKARMKAIFRRSGGSESEGRQSEAARKVISSGSLKLDCDARTLQISGREIYLTAKEFDLMELLASNPGKVYSRESLLNTVWGYDYPGDVRTVDVHVRRLREKVEPNASDPKYIQTKWGVGYYFGQN